MSNMIKTIEYNKVSGGRIQIAFVVFVIVGDDHNTLIPTFPPVPNSMIKIFNSVGVGNTLRGLESDKLDRTNSAAEKFSLQKRE